MKRLVVRLLPVLLSILPLSCTREASPVVQPSGDDVRLVPVTFTASCFTDSKASLNGLKMEWSPGDEIGIAANTASTTIYKFTTRDGGAQAEFAGMLPEGFKAGKAIFPYSSILSNSSTNNFRVSGIPACVQHPGPDGIDYSSVPLSTQFEDITSGTLTFFPLASILKFDVSSSDVREISLRTDGLYPTGGSYPNNDVKCHGALSIPDFSFVNVGCGSHVFNCAYRGEGYVKLRPRSGSTFAPGEYGFVIPATDAKDPRALNNLTVTYTKADGSRWSRTSTKSLTVLPARIYDFNISDADCIKESDEVAPAVVGELIPAWKPGCFDIHFINTQSGEGALLIFPDGTQMLIDCAGSLNATGPVNSTTNEGIRVRWDPTKDSNYSHNIMFEEYIRQCMIWTGNNKLDYVLCTHFHADHFGTTSGKSKSDRYSGYVQQSMPYMLDVFAAGKVMDRGYPTYEYPFDMCRLNATVRNWVAALNWHKEHSGIEVERFQAGADKQITLKYAASDYPSFAVRNIGVNGEVWTGIGNNTRSTFPALQDIVCANPPDADSSDNCPAENHNSTVLKFTYGKFDYWAGGDQQYNGMSSYAWKNSETTMAKACGQVDVMKADHHGTANTNGSGYTAKNGDRALAMQYLKPKCWIVNNWVDGQPRQATFEGVVSVCPDVDIFITNTCQSQTLYGGYAQHMKGADGHIVVRVLPGGDTYYVYVLEDSSRTMKVKTVSGPYTSR